MSDEDCLACVVPDINVGPIDLPSTTPQLNFQAPPPAPIGLTYTTDLAAVLAGAAVNVGKLAESGASVFERLLSMPTQLGQEASDFARLMAGDVPDADFARLMQGDVGSGVLAPEEGLALNPFIAGLGLLLAPSPLGAADTVLDPAALFGAGDFPMPTLPEPQLPPPPDFALPPEAVVFGDRPAPTRAPELPPLIDPGPIGVPFPSGSKPRPVVSPIPAPFIVPQPRGGIEPVPVRTAPMPRPQPLPRASPAPAPSPSTQGPLAGGSPLTGFESQPVPSKAGSPGLATLTMGSCSCTQDEAATKRKQKYGCRQGYFRETSGGITYTTWSTRKCPSSKAKPASAQRGRPITS